MPERFMGEIRILPTWYAPQGWAECDGREIPIRQNTALYAVIGSRFGGDDKMRFNVPNLRGRAPMGWGVGASLTPRKLGDKAGTETAAMAGPDVPVHRHAVHVRPAPGSSFESQAPIRAFRANYEGPGSPISRSSFSSLQQPDVALAEDAVSKEGGGEPHENMQPYVAVMFCIALDGRFPERS